MKNTDDTRKLKDAFNLWAKNVPDPDEPMLGFVGTRLYSAKEISAAVENETQLGRDVLKMVEYAVSKEGIDKVVARLTRQTPKTP